MTTTDDEQPTGVVVRPIRFTDDVEAMRDFLVLLGLQPRIAAKGGGWVDMVAGAGMVALHDAASATSGATAGETYLSFEAEDLDGLAERLTAAGVPDVTIVDEAWGRQVECTDPRGDTVVVGDVQEDLYGFTRSDEEPDRAWRVMPVVFTSPTGRYGEFLTALGLPRDGEPDEHFVVHAGPGESGRVGLHLPDPDATRTASAPHSPVAHLSFETDEWLDDVAARLDEAGFAPSITREDWGAFLSVTDPDGQVLEVHEPPAHPELPSE